MISETERLNEIRKRDRKKIMAKLSALAKEMKQEKSPSDMAALFEEKEELEEKLERLYDIVFPVSDTTPEGLARINNRQGNFAVISDEATSVNSLLGMTYGDGSKKQTANWCLKRGMRAMCRSLALTRITICCLLRWAGISVIAQDETINAIMNAGARGIGVSERFLLVREESFLGRRQFVNEQGESTYEPIDGGLKADYFKLVHAIMSEVDVKLTA